MTDLIYEGPFKNSCVEGDSVTYTPEQSLRSKPEQYDFCSRIPVKVIDTDRIALVPFVVSISRRCDDRQPRGVTY